MQRHGYLQWGSSIRRLTGERHSVGCSSNCCRDEVVNKGSSSEHELMFDFREQIDCRIHDSTHSPVGLIAFANFALTPLNNLSAKSF